MKKLVIVAVVAIAALAAVALYSGMFTDDAAEAAGPNQGAAAGTPGGSGPRGGGPGAAGAGRAPMTVELASARRQPLSEQIAVVGNLIGEATVSVVPRTAGRLQQISVKLGDQVTRGQRIAKIEDNDIVEQVKQAEAAQQVAAATIRQREADLKRAETNVERSRSLFERQLLPQQTLDDNEATYQAALAQVDLARAQNTQSKARLEELRVNLGNTVIVSPVNGFVSRRAVDPGAFVSQNAPVVEVVDISKVRLIANIVEKDLRELNVGNATRVEVDAYPGEVFAGRVARLSPVLDPATRTAPIEIEIPNSGYRLKPGMYARVGITTGTKKDALVVPANAVVDLGGRRGVFQPQNSTAVFHPLQIGVEQHDVIEVLSGLEEGARIVTTGAGTLRDGDQILLSGGATIGAAAATGREAAEQPAAPDAALQETDAERRPTVGNSAVHE